MRGMPRRLVENVDSHSAATLRLDLPTLQRGPRSDRPAVPLPDAVHAWRVWDQWLRVALPLRGNGISGTWPSFGDVPNGPASSRRTPARPAATCTSWRTPC